MIEQKDVKPFISVVIPLYNKGEYILTTIKSVLNQTYSDYEVVIVDDGSTDDSVHIINDSFTDDKLKIYSKPNGGPSSARNFGVQKAHGVWVVFLDADDMLLPFALEYFSRLIAKNDNIDYFVCNYFTGYNTKAKLFSLTKHEGLINNPFYLESTRELTERPGSAIIKKELLIAHPFKEKLRRYEDAECQYEMMRGRKIYQSSIPVMISDRGAGAASFIRKDYHEDFICSLNFENKSYWEQMALYLLALECKRAYPEQAEKRYNHIYKRMDLKAGYLMVKLRRLFYRAILHFIKPMEYDYSYLLNSRNYEEFK